MDEHLPLELKGKISDREIRLRRQFRCWSLLRKAAGLDHRTLRWQWDQGPQRMPRENKRVSVMVIMNCQLHKICSHGRVPPGTPVRLYRLD